MKYSYKRLYIISSSALEKNRIINIVWWFERFYFSSFFITVCFFKGCLNPIQDARGEGGAKSFSPVSSRNVGISSQNFLTFKPIPTASPKLLTLNQTTPPKKLFFWSVMITSITSHMEMLRLPNLVTWPMYNTI